MVYLSPMYNESQLVLKRNNIVDFSRFYGSPFSRHFVYFSGQECAPNALAQCHDLTLDPT